MEKQDKLEQFVKSEREAFDDKVPTDALWMKIDKDLSGKANGVNDKPSYLSFWKVAAVFFFVATTALIIIRWQEREMPKIDQDQVGNEFVMAEAYYMQMIGQKQKELMSSLDVSPELATKFSRDLEVLDSLYLQLHGEMKSGGDVTKVQSAMVQNLRMRIEILNFQLDILENIKTSKNNENESNI